MVRLVQLRKGKGRKPELRRFKLLALDKAPHRLGICMKFRMIKPKKPNSAYRKIVWVRIKFNDRVIIGYIQGTGHSLQPYSRVLIRGGRTPDLPGVKFRFIKGKYDYHFTEDIIRENGRSKYGIPQEKRRAELLQVFGR